MPEVTEKTFYQSRVKAILDERELKLSLTVSAPYAADSGRSAAVTIDSGFSAKSVKAIQDALKGALNEKLQEAVQQAKEVALEAAKFARNQKEKV